MVPMREARKVWRTSTVPTVSSTSSGAQHAGHGVAQVVERLVDDRVVADLDALALGDGARVAHRAHVEAEDDRVGGGGEHDVGLVDAADAGAG